MHSAEKEKHKVTRYIVEKYGTMVCRGLGPLGLGPPGETSSFGNSQQLTPVLFANCVIIGLSAALAGYDHGAASGALQNLVHLKGDTVPRRVMNIGISMDLRIS